MHCNWIGTSTLEEVLPAKIIQETKDQINNQADASLGK